MNVVNPHAYDMERVRDIGQRLGAGLVFAGTVGLFLSTVGIWPPVAIIVAGLALSVVSAMRKP